MSSGKTFHISNPLNVVNHFTVFTFGRTIVWGALEDCLLRYSHRNTAIWVSWEKAAAIDRILPIFNPVIWGHFSIQLFYPKIFNQSLQVRVWKFPKGTKMLQFSYFCGFAAPQVACQKKKPSKKAQNVAWPRNPTSNNVPMRLTQVDYYDSEMYYQTLFFSKLSSD